MKKVKKAFMGLAVEAARKSPMGLIGVGADKILKKSGTARELAGSLGMGGKLLKQYYDKEDSKDKTTGSEQTKQITAKRMGGMAIPDYADGGEVVMGKGKDYIKDLL
jgi:DNA topoisomerase IB